MTGEKYRELLSEGLDLCIRARKMDAMDRRQATLAVSSDPDAWQADGTFDRYVDRHNISNPDQPIAARSGTVPLWLNDQYDKDLADWERRARQALMTSEKDAPAAMPGVEEIARYIIGPRKAVPSDSLFSLAALQEVRWKDVATDAERLDAISAASAVLALFAPILAEKERPGTYFANLLQREWIGPDGIRYEPTRERGPGDVEF